jgi:hypothetical protein
MNPNFICLAVTAVIECVGERYQDAYGVRQRFGEGSFIVWVEITASERSLVQIVKISLVYAI